MHSTPGEGCGVDQRARQIYREKETQCLVAEAIVVVDWLVGGFVDYIVHYIRSFFLCGPSWMGGWIPIWCNSRISSFLVDGETNHENEVRFVLCCFGLLVSYNNKYTCVCACTIDICM